MRSQSLFNYPCPLGGRNQNFSPRIIIRLGFPEWSFWSLPLVAHELGHVVVGEKLEDFLKKQAQDKRERGYLEEYLADAFATEIMGPAYVCAAVLLRLNPSDLISAKRAWIMFNILEGMDEKSGGEMREIFNILWKAWESAVNQTGSKMLADQDIMELKAFTDNYLNENKEDLVRDLMTYSFDKAAWNTAQVIRGSVDAKTC